MKNLFASLVLITLATASYSATVYTTANTGTLNWSEISWTATGTGAPRTWIVPSELTATINTNITLEDSLKVAGVLNFKSNTSLTMNTGGMLSLISGETSAGIEYDASGASPLTLIGGAGRYTNFYKFTPPSSLTLDSGIFRFPSTTLNLSTLILLNAAQIQQFEVETTSDQRKIDISADSINICST